MEQPLFFVLRIADVIAMWQDETATFALKDGRCYCQVADVIATVYLCDGRCYSQVADGITTQEWVMVFGRCYDQVGRWNSHRVCFLMLILVLRCYTEPHPRYVADGTCQYFYSGVDYWPWCRELLWWFSLGSGPLSPLCWSYLCWPYDQRCYSGHRWGMGLLVFFEPFSKSSGGLSYIFLITLHSITFVSVDDPTLFQHRILVLGGHQEVFDGDTSSEVDLNPMFVASSFHTFT